METKTKNHLLKLDWEEFEELINTTPRTLSFCDLPELEKPEPNNPNLSSFNQDFFEFSTTKNPEKLNPTLDNYIIFCGKLISPKGEDKKPNQESPSGVLKSSSSRPCRTQNQKKNNPFSPRQQPAVLGKERTLHQSLGKSIKQRVYIGMGKSGPPGIMELSDIKQRQRKMAAERFEVGETLIGASSRSLVVVDGNGRDGTGKGQWSLLRSLGFRAHLSSVLTKAPFRCLSISAVS